MQPTVASFCFIVGAGFDAREGRHADTADTPEQVPLWRFADVESLTCPQRCEAVGVALLMDDAVDLPSFRHPVNAAWCWGRSAPASHQPCWPAAATWCAFPPGSRSTSRSPVRLRCAFDRLLQHGRFAERPVGSRGPVAEEPLATRHGSPRFRRNVPDWARS